MRCIHNPSKLHENEGFKIISLFKVVQFRAALHFPALGPGWNDNCLYHHFPRGSGGQPGGLGGYAKQPTHEDHNQYLSREPLSGRYSHVFR